MSADYDPNKYCPVTVTQNMLMGKWKMIILWFVNHRTRRFGELQRLMPGISRGVLTQQLRELEKDNLIHRTVYGEVPPRVEYSITETGKSFIPVMMKIMEWGVGYIKETTDCDMGSCIAGESPCFHCHEMFKATEI